MVAITELRDLDRAIAEARGCMVYSPNPDALKPIWRVETPGGYYPWETLPSFATDPAWTLRLLEEMRDSGTWAVDEIRPQQHGYSLYMGKYRIAQAPTLPEAVARAWLAWHEATKSPAG